MSLRRLSADHLESLANPKLLGTGEHARTVSGQTSDSGDELRNERQRILDAARDQGLTEGRKQAEAEIRAQVEKIALRLREEQIAAMKRTQAEQERFCALAASLREAVAIHGTDSDVLAVEVAFTAVVRLLGEKSAQRSLIAELCQQVVHEFGHPPATLRVSQADLALLDDVELGIPVEADRRLAPGQCVIDTARGQFDSGLDVRLEGLRKALLATLAEHRSQP